MFETGKGVDGVKNDFILCTVTMATYNKKLAEPKKGVLGISHGVLWLVKCGPLDLLQDSTNSFS